ncbi:MAG: hypothetical protein EBR27_10075 [Betaproteobacteria bacterium]|nr:hypothetical protein [Betaproteobacteria bacterium]
MNLLDQLVHVFYFGAPAVFLALALPACVRLFRWRQRTTWSWSIQALLIFLTGLSVLCVGFWHFGADGKMTTYAAMVLTAASVQWLVS